MTSATLTGFLSKKEIEANYGRSYRSLTRDITRAVKSHDAEVLRHLKLVTDDDQIREGIEVTFDLIQELSNGGLRPMWLAEEMWVAEWCAKKANPVEKKQAPIQKQPDQQPVLPNTNVESSAVVQMLHQRNTDLAAQNALLVDQLKIKDDQIRAANQQAEQSQQLMRDLHVLLKNVQDGLLGEGNPALISAPKKSHRSPVRPVTVVTDPIPTKATSDEKTAVKKKKASKRAPAQKPNVGPEPTTLQRWFPTFLGTGRSRKT